MHGLTCSVMQQEAPLAHEKHDCALSKDSACCPTPLLNVLAGPEAHGIECQTFLVREHVCFVDLSSALRLVPGCMRFMAKLKHGSSRQGTTDQTAFVSSSVSHTAGGT